MAPGLGELSNRPEDKDRCIPEQRKRPRLERWKMELSSQAPHAPDHAPWMDVSAQISSLGTRMEENTWISIRLASLLDLSTSSRDLST
ncbi:hypothetical protein AAG906_027703 [Vitis piasezkii]